MGSSFSGLVVQLVTPSVRGCLQRTKVVRMFFTYIIRSLKDGSYYIGQTGNLEKRLDQHNQGFSDYTSKKLPWEIVYAEEYQSRNEAIKRERFLKKQRNRSFYNKLAEEFKVRSGSSAG